MKLEIQNISKTYENGVKALQSISLTIEKGMFGLLGQNGAGKSTLMRTIATLQEPDTGEVNFNGIDIINKPEELRRTLGYLPQEFGVYPNVTGEELLLHIADMKGVSSKNERKDLVQALLQKVNLYEARDKNLDGYSGGMKQRFGIAQALIGNPKLIIVDEPTAGLDPMERNRFYNLLSELGESAVVILSTHIVEDVSTLCDKMAVIGGGKLLLEGVPHEIESELNEKLWEVQINKEELSDYQLNNTVISNRFHAGKLIVTILSDDMPNEKCWRKAPTLEDVYFNVINNTQQSILL